MIDIHCHMAFSKIYSEYFIDGIVKELNNSFEDKEKNNTNWNLVKTLVINVLSDAEGKKLIKQMDEAGIEKSVLLIADLFYNTDEDNNGEKIKWIHKFHYDFLQKYPDRFIIFSGVDPRRGEKGIELFKKSIEEYKFKGLKLYPPCGFEIDDIALTEYYELCRFYHLPVLIHTGPSLKDMYLSKKYPLTIKIIANKFKEVNFILAHSGILYFNEGLELAKEYNNIYLDISGFQKESNNIESIKNKMKILFKEIPKKVIFGSDWPLYNFNISQKKWIRYIKDNCGLTSNDYENLFNENAKKILKL